MPPDIEYEDLMSAINDLCRLQYSVVKRREWILEIFNHVIETNESKNEDSTPEPDKSN